MRGWMDVTESRCADDHRWRRQHCTITSRQSGLKPRGCQPLSHTQKHTLRLKHLSSAWQPPPTISACKDFFIGVCHALSFPRKTAVPSYEVIALISAWLRAWTWAPSFIITVWFFSSPWIQPGHAKTLPFMTACLKSGENEAQRCLRILKWLCKTDKARACLIHENHIRADHILFHFILIQLASDQKEKAVCERKSDEPRLFPPSGAFPNQSYFTRRIIST